MPAGSRRQALLAPLRAGAVLGRRSRGLRRSGAGLDRALRSRGVGLDCAVRSRDVGLDCAVRTCGAGSRRGHCAGGWGRARRRARGAAARPDAHRGQGHSSGQDRGADQLRPREGAMASGLRYRGGLGVRLGSAMRPAAEVVAPPGDGRVRRLLGLRRAGGAVGGSPDAPGRARSVVAVHHALRIEDCSCHH